MTSKPASIPRVPRASYADIKLYAPPRVPVELDLSDNTNQWGAPPSVARTLATVDPTVVTQYPSQPMTELQVQLARYAGTLDPDTVVTGCGSDDLLDCIIRAFAEPGDIVAHAQPTFSMIPYFARTNGLTSVAVPFINNWDIDAEAVLATRARIIYLCSPNNPTGTVISEEAVQRMLQESQGIVIMDEAYVEFARHSWSSRAGRQDRLIVTRTMSKAFGLAGMRIGYALAAPALVHEIEKARGPYKVNVLAERLALGVLNEDRDWVASRAADAIAAREWLDRELRQLGLAPLPSEANFLLVPVNNASGIATEVAARGIQLRAFTALAGVGDAIRISVAPLPKLMRLMSVLREILALRSTGSSA